MPFSWKKKTRCTRFSQLVADHLQSPKRGGSLVVETGFPTSLIDLYVRNRGRFRKSSAKKYRGNESPTPLSSPSQSPSQSSGLGGDSNNSSLSSSSSFLVDSDNLYFSASDYGESDEIVEEDVVFVDGTVASDSRTEIENSSITVVEKSDELAKGKPVLVAAFNVLLMVVLILVTKRLTIGITLSAFLLFFLELVAKPLLGRSSFMKPSVDSKTLFESSFQETMNIKSSKENTTLVVCSEVFEIEEKVESKEEVRSEKELDEVRSEGSMEIRHKSSRRAIMKSKMKKLVPKKLRKSSMGSKDEISCEFKEEESVKSTQDLKPLVLSSKFSDSKGETLCILKQKQDKIVGIEGRSLSSTLSSKIDCNDKEIGRELPQNSGCFVLCLIILVGLIGGRALALVLALSWCLVLKKLQWRNVNLPIS